MNPLEIEIKDHFLKTREQIKRTAEKCGRNPDDIKLVVVTKKQPVEKVKMVIEAGAQIIGENYPEEGEEKIKALQQYKHIQWHMIGHLQSRKIPILINNFSMLESLDSISLAEKINHKFSQNNKKMPALVEINISGEESKNGIEGWNETEWDKLATTIKLLAENPGLQIEGLMTMPPYYDEMEKARPYFKKMSRLKKYLTEKKEMTTFIKDLSMGTSGDYQVAIEEGATYIRIGTAIMGRRNYQSI